VFALHGELVVAARSGGAADGSIGDWWPAARWAEQELIERRAAPRGAGVVSAGQSERRLTAPDADLLDRRVAGSTCSRSPYGPVRSGIFEAIQFQIETGGEDVPRIQTRPFFKHRGMEQRFVGLSPERAVYVAERVAGIASAAYASAFSQAVERALGVRAAGAGGVLAVRCTRSSSGSRVTLT